MGILNIFTSMGKLIEILGAVLSGIFVVSKIQQNKELEDTVEKEKIEKSNIETKLEKSKDEKKRIVESDKAKSETIKTNSAIDCKVQNKISKINKDIDSLKDGNEITETI